MPIYEYSCKKCKTIIQHLILNRDDEKQPCCTKCGSLKLKRVISSVVYHTSEQDRIDSYDPTKHRTDSFYQDTRNIGLHAKKRAQQMGVNLGSDFESKLEKLRTDPSSVIKDNE